LRHSPGGAPSKLQEKVALAKSKTVFAMAPYVSREDQEERRTYGSTSPWNSIFDVNWSSPKTWAIVAAIVLVLIVVIYMLMRRSARGSPSQMAFPE